MSEINLDPYLFFNGNCAEAMDFYKVVFGGELTLMKFGDMPMEAMENADQMKDKIMHALLDGGDIRLMASDSRDASEKMAKVELSLGGEDSDKLTKIFNDLKAGGTVRSELKKETWGDTFGMLTDKFGIDWMVNIIVSK